MKIYPKTYQNLSKTPSQKAWDRVSAVGMTLDEYTAKVRSFLRYSHETMFDILVRQVWLESKFSYGGKRRESRAQNGFFLDWIYGLYMRNVVGISHKAFTTGLTLQGIPTFFPDFFPDFYKHDPFTEPEYYKYPYEHVTLDFLMYVYPCEERLEMLDYAEKNQMTIGDFYNWATNQALNTLDKKGNDVYFINRHSFIPSIKRYDKKQIWKKKKRKQS